MSVLVLEYIRKNMISMVLPLIFLCMNAVKKSLLSILFCPLIVLDICFWYCVHTVFVLFDDIIYKSFFDAPPKKIESPNTEEIRRGKIFLDKLMGYWQSRSIIINELVRFEFLNLFYEFSIRSCLATVAPSFTREGNCLLREENGRIRIKARLHDGDIILEGPILLNFLNYKKIINSYLRIHHITAYIEFDFDGRTMKNGNLIDIKIEYIKSFFMYFRGGSLLHHVLSVATSRFISLNYYVMRRIVQRLLTKYLHLHFDKFEFFVDKAGPSTSASGGYSSESETTLTSSEISDHEFQAQFAEESFHYE